MKDEGPKVVFFQGAWFMCWPQMFVDSGFRITHFRSDGLTLKSQRYRSDSAFSQIALQSARS